MSSHAALSAAADERKARLAQLKSLKRKQSAAVDEDSDARAPSSASVSRDDDHGSPPATATTAQTTTASSSTTSKDDAAALQHLSGRNYDPLTRGAKLGFDAPPTLNLKQPTLEQQAAQLEEAARAQESGGSGGGGALDAARGIDLLTLQPRRPNWDLKRELAARMEVLNVRTENAIARLVRERLAERKKEAEEARGAGAAAGEVMGAGGEGGDADGLLDGAAFVEGIRRREREEEEEARREREAEAEEFGTA
ncbi:uncharacterized protein THITE_2106505 [Thermothielavioides terrestris NRRL 8126]|uniref:Cwf18 pre-mRNA splicing factor-like protein n=1 Tax=Thermothielavioides terrestris (strain ATCC 38088 / NRRL 8126) TaxID=578455 RepID=G2QQI4_THETT|nr:uncharacterized protein THITE_2106505 [Thermothielavioides terrestris NRRL 8126]AEO62394.1 hypothetical protein THITE_2106505 [Thermothielavioides terrestris NRRL 8126]